MRRVLALSAAALVLMAGPALAHVTVNAPGATQGGFTKLTFRVPTEKDVPTTKLEVVFPTDAPLAFASVKPHAGWTYKVVTRTLTTPISSDDGDVTDVVSTITWTATAGGIKPGEFDEFEVSAGPLPEKDEITFKALQTYSDGDVVRWIESGEDAEHPAPVLKLAAASADSAHHGGASPSPSAGASVSAAPVASDDDDEDSDGLGAALGGAGLGLGAIALLVSIAAFRRGRAT